MMESRESFPHRAALLLEELAESGGSREILRYNIPACARAWHEGEVDWAQWNDAEWEEFREFCLSQFARTEKDRQRLFAKLDYYIDVIFSHSISIYRETRREHDIDNGRKPSPEDAIIAGYSPLPLATKEMKRSKISALVQLNFAHTQLEEPEDYEGWAMRRMSETQQRKNPPQDLTAALETKRYEAERFTSSFNISLNCIYLAEDIPASTEEKRMLAHWGMRSELVVGDESPEGLRRRRGLCELFEAITSGKFPRECIDTNRCTWRVGSEVVEATETGEIWKATPIGSAPWELFREVFLCHRRLDPYREHGNYYEETFKRHREMPDVEVISLLEQVLSSEEVKEILKKAMAPRERALEAFDLYLPLNKIENDLLQARLEYREPQDLERALPIILERIGFNDSLINEVVPRIAIERSRGPGHAFWPGHDKDRASVRCRISSDGMTRSEFSIFLHELGHAVEMVFSTFDRTHRVLRGVPNPAFTEAFALYFQSNLSKVLGEPSTPASDATTLLRLLNFAGPALCEIELYRWLYQQDEVPAASRIHDRFLRINDEVWQRYYSSLFGERSYNFLAGPPHVLWGTFYLAEYFLGEIISWQISNRLEQSDDVGIEIQRMCRIGRVSPAKWMEEAVGASISLAGLIAPRSHAPTCLASKRKCA